MIYDGRNGYVSGDLSQPNNTVLAMTKGPVKGRNFYSSHNPAYSISMSNGATGTVSLQGTNDIALRETEFLPTENASWTDIQAATSTSVTGTFATEYEFLRIKIVATGTGFVTQAWVRWS
jgi:hypothetical protein